ncbi:MAG: phosphoribosylamine--glycine ligase [Ignavibacteria bacterium]|nr:phosphoribosylamine--glycine ligase [Ignavibacteria bacterium]
MKILLIGNGGRENALAWKIYNSKSFRQSESKLYCTIGSPGLDEFSVPVDIKPVDFEKLIKFVKEEGIDFTVVGPEVPLSLGIVNEFEKNGLKIFGPCKEAAEIESSKIFAKDLMLSHNVPTANYKTFIKNNLPEAGEFLNKCEYPVVIKDDGLAAGKGVVIANNLEEANEAVDEFRKSNRSGDAGFKFIIEEYLKGEEISVFVITDGDDYVVLPYSQDHKKIREGEKGKNTGGMGAVAPLKKFMNEDLDNRIRSEIIEPTLKALRETGREFKGCLYCGLMVTDNKPYVIEFNCRFGDPETQAVLPLIESDFLKLLLASSGKEIKEYSLVVNQNFTCCVVMASKGYPDNFETEKEIKGLDVPDDKSIVFQSEQNIHKITKS